jgi:glycosyltransferase involved in cell wall biosynthesis
MLSVIIPAYNEEDGIASIVERVLAIGPALRTAKTELELIVVDDGSRDRTAEIAERYPDVRLIRHRRRWHLSPRALSRIDPRRHGEGGGSGDWLAHVGHPKSDAP